MNPSKYAYLDVTVENQVATIRLNRPPYNALNIAMMKEIAVAHALLDKTENVRAILLTSAVDGYFSNGLDIDDLLEADSGGKLAIFENLYDMCQAIYSSPKIHAAFLNGHAMAGGAVCAAMSDFRFFSEGQYRISFSETRIGLALPQVFLKIIKSIVGVQNLKNTALLAQAYKPHEAREINLVDDLFAPHEALSKIHKFLARTLQIPTESYRAVKDNMRKEYIEMLQTDKKATLEWISRFFTDNLTEGLRASKEKRRANFK